MMTSWPAPRISTTVSSIYSRSEVVSCFATNTYRRVDIIRHGTEIRFDIGVKETDAKKIRGCVVYYKDSTLMRLEMLC